MELASSNVIIQQQVILHLHKVLITNGPQIV